MQKIEESFSVYLNGAVPTLGSIYRAQDTLGILIEQFRKSGKTDAQIYAILYGMGIDQMKIASRLSPDSVSIPEATEDNIRKAQYFQTVISVEEQKNENTKMKDFSTKALGNVLKEAVSKLQPLAEDNSRISHSAKTSMAIIESAIAKIDSLKIEEKEKLSVELTVSLAEAFEKNSDGSIQGVVGEYEKKLKQISESLIEANYSVRFDILGGLAKSLKTYDHIPAVSEALSYIEESIVSNRFSMRAYDRLKVLSSDRFSKMYEKAIEDLKIEITKGEEHLKENFSSFEKHAWIPTIAGMIKEFASESGKLATAGFGKIRRNYSPVQVNEDNSITFHLDGNFYSISEGKLEKVTEKQVPSNSFVKTLQALKLFKVNESGFNFFNGTKTLTIGFNGEVFINEKKLENSSSTIVAAAIKESTLLKMDQLHVGDLICHLVESINSVKELDFVSSIDSVVHKGVTVNVIKMNESIYLNRINSTMKVNETVEVTSAKVAQELVNEFVNYDITPLVYDLLEAESKEAFNLQNQKNLVDAEIKFLEEKLSDLEKTYKLTGENSLQEAIDFIKSEMVSKEKELIDIYAKLEKKS
jgi:hypothetical protein